MFIIPHNVTLATLIYLLHQDIYGGCRCASYRWKKNETGMLKYCFSYKVGALTHEIWQITESLKCGPMRSWVSRLIIAFERISLSWTNAYNNSLATMSFTVEFLIKKTDRKKKNKTNNFIIYRWMNFPIVTIWCKKSISGVENEMVFFNKRTNKWKRWTRVKRAQH